MGPHLRRPGHRLLLAGKDPERVPPVVHVQSRAEAEDNVKSSLALSALAEAENLKFNTKSNHNGLNALDFFRANANSSYNLYHHIGIYAFTNEALIRYVGLKRSKLELER